MRTIIPVHLCGQPADMDTIMEIAKYTGAYVIEDCCQAIGATYKGRAVGTIGDCGIFSFGAPKTLTTGTGGMLITNNHNIWDIASKVRNHGEMTGDMVLGYNYRMTEMSAAMGIVQLEKLDWQNETRRKLADRLTRRLSEISGIVPPQVRKGCTHVYYTYAVKTTLDRHKICTELGRKGIYFGEGYSVPLNRIPIYQSKQVMPVAEDMYDKTLMVTDIIRPPATLEDMEFIADSFEEICSSL